jgi:predicted Zn-dependent peptidase
MTRLGNGMRVLVLPDQSIPIASIHLAVAAGARHDTPGRTGLAHLVEHMMFTGPARSYAEHVQAAGGRFTATTSFQRTTYGQTVPAGELDRALAREATRLARLAEGFTDHDTAVQRKVVAGERRRRHTGRPYGTALPRLFRQAHHPGDPSANLPLGDPEDVASLTAADCRDFLARHYTPADMILTIAGDAIPEIAVELVSRHFDGFPGEPCPSAAPYGEMTGARGEWREDVPAEGLFALIRLPAEDDAEFPAARTGVRIAESRLSSAGEALITAARFRVLRLGAGPAMASLRVIAAPGVTAVTIEDLVRQVIESLITTPASAAELARAQAQEDRDHLDRTATLAGWADETSRTAMFRAGRADESPDALMLGDGDAVGAEDVAAGTWLGREWAATLHCLPRESR